MDDDSKYQPVRFHPLADLFPLMTDAGMAALAADIKANGLREPIEMWGGAIIDGRNRSLACEMAGVEPVRVDVDFPDEATALRYVVSKNLFRRHLTADQRAEVARQVANMPRGRPRTGTGAGLISQAEAATAFHVSERSVRNAKVVYERGSPELQAAVKAGEVGLREAAEQVREQERSEAEPRPVSPADIGAQHRRQRELAERATIRALDVEQIAAWLDRALDSQRREVAVAAFAKIKAAADRWRVAEVILPWVKEFEKGDAQESAP